MKCKVMGKSVIEGQVRYRGDVIEVPPETAEYWKGVLMPVSEQDTSTSECAKEDEILVAGLTRDQAILKLRELGVNVSPKIGDKKLKERFLESFKVDL